ncbi:glutathione S-transferase [Pleurotus eryngii]|uniref:Glutathione S-transferase n=1 Tax=Pleurotus eryngii TaxID=5323 RepID=A0A9P6A0D4_PLEER|nr:glutathione S-transferase [Pleurotus eryngii]
MPETLTLYTAKICPYAQRTELALEEAHADYTRYEIDLSNKPEWYAPRVNPASKVPAVAYGGPKTAPDQPSPESEKIAESLVLLEFIADLYPESNLLPKDPVLRAKARFFIDAFSTKVSPFYMGFVARGEPFDNLLKGFEALQSLLPPADKGPFALGSQFSIADAAVLPFIARLYVAMKNDIGGFAKGVGPASLKILQEDEKYKRFKAYVNTLFERESFKKTFHEDVIAETYKKRFGRPE